ncbi:MAG: TIGR01906 family membrane protein [Anaerolineae bacterium]|jgi:integral membrane protein (TIGR01906 family)
MTKLLPRLLQWLLVLLLPLLLVVANLRIANGHWFVRWEYNKPGFPPDDYGLTTEERTRLAEVCVDYLAPGASISLLADLRLPNGDPAFYERELGHMVDVQRAFTQVTVAAGVGVLLWIVGFVVLAVPRQRRRVAAATLLTGGFFTLGLLAVIGAVMAVSWWEFFTAFHRIFFSEGTWVFEYTDTLIRLFPMQLWIDVAVVVVVLLVIEAILIGAVGWVWGRRIKAGI